jgi:negative regulator of sigma E activity
VTRRVVVTALVVVAALPWAMASLSSTDAAGQGSGTGAQLVEQMREASSDWSFGGTVELTWRDAHDETKTHHATVDVTATYGTVEVAAGSHRIVDDVGTTYVLGDEGWSTVLMAPVSRALPAADHAWKLTTRPGPEIAGRPTTTVVAARDGRSPAQRLFIDRETHLLLGREVRDAEGRVDRSLRFTSFAVEGGPVASNPAAAAGGSGAATLKQVPDGYRAPSSTDGGYELIAKAKGSDGGVLLSYSDGIFTISVSERTGDLDWDALAKGGTSTTVAGHAARTYSEPGGEVIVWQGDGVVFTCVSDAPTDVTATMIAGLSPSGRSAIEKAVDYVLGPFGWH